VHALPPRVRCAGRPFQARRRLSTPGRLRAQSYKQFSVFTENEFWKRTGEPARRATGCGSVFGTSMWVHLVRDS
jgi:hypothetical protein